MNPLPTDPLPPEEPFLAEISDDAGPPAARLGDRVPMHLRSQRAQEDKAHGAVRSRLAVWSCGISIAAGVGAILATVSAISKYGSSYGWALFALNGLLLVAGIGCAAAALMKRGRSSSAASIAALGIFLGLGAMLLTGAGALFYAGVQQARSRPIARAAPGKRAPARRPRVARANPSQPTPPQAKSAPPTNPLHPTPTPVITGSLEPLAVKSLGAPAQNFTKQLSPQLDPQQGHLVAKYILHDVNPAIAPQWLGDRLVVAASDGVVVIRLSDFTVEKRIAVEERVTALGTSSAGLLVGIGGFGVAIVNPTTLQVEHVTAPYGELELAASPKSPWLVAATPLQTESESLGSFLEVQNMRTRQLLVRCDANGWSCVPKQGKSATDQLALRSLHPSPDGKSLVGCNKELHRLVVDGSNLIYEERTDAAPSHSQSPVHFSADGKKLARLCGTGENNLVVLAMNDWKKPLFALSLDPASEKTWAPAADLQSFYSLTADGRVCAMDQKGREFFSAELGGIYGTNARLVPHPDGRHLLVVTPGHLHWFDLGPLQSAALPSASYAAQGDAAESGPGLFEAVPDSRVRYDRITFEMSAEVIPAWNEKGDAFFTAHPNATISRIGLKGLQRKVLLHTPDEPHPRETRELRVTPSRVLVVGDDTGVPRFVTLNADSLDAQQQFFYRGLKSCAATTHVGRLFGLTQRGEIVVLDLERMIAGSMITAPQLQRAAQGTPLIQHIAASPDGKRLLLCGRRWLVYQMDEPPKLLSSWEPPPGVQSPAFLSHNGTHYAARGVDRKWQVYKVGEPQPQFTLDGGEQVLGFMPRRAAVVCSDFERLLTVRDYSGKPLADFAPLPATQRSAERVALSNGKRVLAGSKKDWWLIDWSAEPTIGGLSSPTARNLGSSNPPEPVDAPAGYEALRLELPIVSGEKRRVLWIDGGKALAVFSQKQGTTYAARIDAASFSVTHLVELQDGVALAVACPTGVWVQGQGDTKLHLSAADFSITRGGASPEAIDAAGAWKSEQIYLTRGEDFTIQVIQAKDRGDQPPAIALDTNAFMPTDAQKKARSYRFVRLWLTPSANRLIACDNQGYLSTFDVVDQRLTLRGTNTVPVAPEPLAISVDGKRLAARPGKPEQPAPKPSLFDPSSIPPAPKPADVYVFDLDKLGEPVLKLPEKMGVVTSLDYDARGQLFAGAGDAFPPLATAYDAEGEAIETFTSPAPGQPPGFMPAAFLAHPSEATWVVHSTNTRLYRLKKK
jgi:hypothetical protein